MGMVNNKSVVLEKERDKLRDDIVYLQSQSMRNNLIFSNIKEAADESVVTAEVVVIYFIYEKMKVAKDVMDTMGLERVHRIVAKEDEKIRSIVAKFSSFKERESS